MTPVETCPHCEQEYAWLTTYAGRRRPFLTRTHHPGDIPGAEAWYPLRGRGMTPASVLPDRDTVGRPFLIEHLCNTTAIVDGHAVTPPHLAALAEHAIPRPLT